LIPPEPGETPAPPVTPPTGPLTPATEPLTPSADGPPTDPPARPGASTFTIEGRQAPALFVIGWLATIVGLGAVVVALLGGANPASPFLLIAGLVISSIGLVAGAGSQGIERRARGAGAYEGPSPFLVFAASIPVSLLVAVLIGIPLAIAGAAVDGPLGRLGSVIGQTVVYIGLIRLLVVDTGALSWAQMGLRRFDGRALTDLAGGALWALPVIALTIPVAAILTAVFPVQPVSPLPPAGEPIGIVANLIAGAIVAPIGEEILFRGFATTAWARDLGPRRALVRGAIFFAAVHVLTVAAATASEAFGLIVIGFATRLPVALALGWLFLHGWGLGGSRIVRGGSIWGPIGLHATFNGILLVLGEAALRSGA
jgi:membrane protease YdiL (CAAX protease family)